MSDGDPQQISPMLGVGVHVWCIGLQHDPGLVARARSVLSSDEHQRADAFRFQQLRDEFAVARATLRVLLSQLVGLPPADLRFSYGPRGKPALEERTRRAVQFNASHSGGMYACAFVQNRLIGIDV
jgi:4'-phosphopantetheinyl transferase